MKSQCFLICLTVLCVTGVYAQDIYSVSDLEVKNNGSEVILTWKDNENIEEEHYKILRHYKGITKDNYTNATILGEIKPGVEAFTDRPPHRRQWWYAVLTSTDNTIYNTFQEWRNYFPLPVTVESMSELRNDIAKIIEFKVEPNDLGVQLEYTADKNDREIVIFRSLQFIDSPEVLDYAKNISRSTGRTGEIIDKPKSGIPYYYAAVDAQIFDSAYPQMMDFIAFSPPITTSYNDKRNVSTIRPTPLPQLSFSDEYQDVPSISDIGGEFPPRIPLSVETELIINSILNSTQVEIQDELQPEILAIDRGYSSHRRQQSLQAILEGSFAKKKWERAESELFALSVSNGINQAMKSRILYYQGQALYFLNRYRQAFASFVLSSNDYYTKSRRWILHIYEKLHGSF